jgi:hypothetical protein
MQMQARPEALPGAIPHMRKAGELAWFEAIPVS